MFARIGQRLVNVSQILWIESGVQRQRDVENPDWIAYQAISDQERRVRELQRHPVPPRLNWELVTITWIVHLTGGDEFELYEEDRLALEDAISKTVGIL